MTYLPLKQVGDIEAEMQSQGKGLGPDCPSYSAKSDRQNITPTTNIDVKKGLKHLESG